MGTDIYTMVGRVKPKGIGYTSGDNPLLVDSLDKEPLDFSRFEFLNYDADELGKEEARGRNVPRDYDFFAWLGDDSRRDDILPLMPDVEALKEATLDFLAWAGVEYEKIPLDQRPVHSYDVRRPPRAPRNFRRMYIHGYRDYVLYPLLTLKGFNYDAPVQVAPQREWETTETYLIRVEKWKGKTYRDFVPPQFHAFLDWALENNWQFVVFAFCN